MTLTPTVKTCVDALTNAAYLQLDLANALQRRDWANWDHWSEDVRRRFCINVALQTTRQIVATLPWLGHLYELYRDAPHLGRITDHRIPFPFGGPDSARLSYIVARINQKAATCVQRVLGLEEIRSQLHLYKGQIEEHGLTTRLLDAAPAITTAIDTLLCESLTSCLEVARLAEKLPTAANFWLLAAKEAGLPLLGKTPAAT